MKVLLILILLFTLFSFSDEFVSEDSEWIGSTTINVPAEEIDGIPLEDLGSDVTSESSNEIQWKSDETHEEWEE